MSTLWNNSLISLNWKLTKVHLLRELSFTIKVWLNFLCRKECKYRSDGENIHSSTFSMHWTKSARLSLPLFTYWCHTTSTVDALSLSVIAGDRSDPKSGVHWMLPTKFCASLLTILLANGTVYKNDPTKWKVACNCLWYVYVSMRANVVNR